jgi:lysophospholipase L1-like esterase
MRGAPLLAGVILALAACSGGGDATDAAPDFFADVEGGAYIALGDSVAAGSGASDPEVTSYRAIVLGALEERVSEVTHTSLATGGATTQSLIDTQLDDTVALASGGDVALITLTIGGNDLAEYSSDPACVADPGHLDCPLEEGLLEVERRLDTIMSRLREAAQDAVIVAQLYPNLFSGTGHEFTSQAETAFGLLNGVIAGVAGRHDVLLADPRDEFANQGQHLTHLVDDVPDAHPNDAGHEVIANAFLEVLGLAD